MPRAYWEHYHKNAGKLALLGAWTNLFLGVGRLPVFGPALCCFVCGGSLSSRLFVRPRARVFTAAW